LHANDKNDVDRLPANESSEQRSKEPRERRIENEARLAIAEVGPLCPAWKQNTLLPLTGGVEPRSQVKRNVMAGCTSQVEKRGYHRK
jgi:hypothetical protein